MKWEQLRKDIKEHGLRHSTLSAQMPSESSSVVSNATNGIEPPRDYLVVKKSKKGTLKQVVPDYQRLKNSYTLLWDMKGNDRIYKYRCSNAESILTKQLVVTGHTIPNTLKRVKCQYQLWHKTC